VGFGHNHYFVFSQKEGVLLTKRFNENRWQPSTAFLLKTLVFPAMGVAPALLHPAGGAVL
jgi:hypothetical protein